MKYILAIVLGLMSMPTHATTLRGPAKVVDGDTLEISGRRVRLFGIDAPEGAQNCESDGQGWACGKASAERLQALIGDRFVQCGGNEVDIYGRLLAVCMVDGVSLNRLMVSEGWATAFRRYSEDYVADETIARANKLGLWSSSFMTPEDYRMAEDARPENQPLRSSEESQPTLPSPSSCAIKGNHSRRGELIYHLPGMPYYDETRAEEMFCTEAEAQAAGYRRSRAR